MLAKFADDDRIEQMNAQKRRMKQLEHKRAVEKLLEERQQQYAIDRVRVTSCGHEDLLHWPSAERNSDVKQCILVQCTFGGTSYYNSLMGQQGGAPILS